jgi:hypothetical protein
LLLQTFFQKHFCFSLAEEERTRLDVLAQCNHFVNVDVRECYKPQSVFQSVRFHTLLKVGRRLTRIRNIQFDFKTTSKTNTNLEDVKLAITYTNLPAVMSNLSQLVDFCPVIVHDALFNFIFIILGAAMRF